MALQVYIHKDSHSLSRSLPHIESKYPSNGKINNMEDIPCIIRDLSHSMNQSRIAQHKNE